MREGESVIEASEIKKDKENSLSFCPMQAAQTKIVTPNLASRWQHLNDASFSSNSLLSSTAEYGINDFQPPKKMDRRIASMWELLLVVKDVPDKEGYLSNTLTLTKEAEYCGGVIMRELPSKDVWKFGN